MEETFGYHESTFLPTTPVLIKNEFYAKYNNKKLICDLASLLFEIEKRW